MSPYGVIEIVDQEGWRKSFPLEKTITFVGSAAGNDIVLQDWRGSGVAPRQLQVIAMPSDGQRCRVVNLGPAHLTVTGLESRLIAPHSVGEIAAGESIQFGDFSLILSDGTGTGPVAGVVAATAAPSPPTETPGRPSPSPGDSASPQPTPAPPRPAVVPPAMRASQKIGLSLVMAHTELSPDRALTGAIKVSNRGDKTGVQFKIELEGLDPEIYEIGPAPILFPNAEREVALEIHHPCGPVPQAGEHRFQVRVTAPREYPGEAATAYQTIRILPYYEHRLKVVELE